MEVDHAEEKDSKPDDGFKAPMAMPAKPVTPVSSEEKSEPKTKASSKSPAEIAFGGGSKNPPLAYKEPPWSGLPPEGDAFYSLEEIKSGTIVATHKLIGKSHFVVGRLPACDIQVC
jgi:hypothetical protein